jgi:hypothetical protein
MTEIRTKRLSGSSTGFESGEMFCGNTAQQIGRSDRGVQVQAVTEDDAHAEIARQCSGNAQK